MVLQTQNFIPNILCTSFQISYTPNMTQNHQHGSVFYQQPEKKQIGAQIYQTGEDFSQRTKDENDQSEISGDRRRREQVWRRPYYRRSLRISTESLKKAIF